MRASLVDQDTPRTEVIIVDDASTDRTPEILDELAQRIRSGSSSSRTNVGKKRALGRAMQVARGDLFAFTDSDSVWAADAIERVVRVFTDDPDVGAVERALSGRATRTKNVLTRMQDSWYEGQFSVRKAFESVFGAVTCVSGPMAVFRREADLQLHPRLGAGSIPRTGVPLRDRPHPDRVRPRLASGKADRSSSASMRSSEFLAVDYPWHHWKVVYSKSDPLVDRGAGDSLGRSSSSRSAGRRAFSATCGSPAASIGSARCCRRFVYYLHALFVLVGPLVAFRHLVYMPLHGNVESMVLYLAGITLDRIDVRARLPTRGARRRTGSSGL